MAQTLATGPERDARFGSILSIGLSLANGRYLRTPAIAPVLNDETFASNTSRQSAP
jgi:hypothetical protein